MELLFAYGSLTARAPGGRPARLGGFRRSWGVAMDNAVDLPGYKYFVDPATRRRPPVHVAFVDVVEDAAAATDGLLLPVDRGALARLDARERNYTRRRVEVNGAPAWLYAGRADARSRLRRALEAGTAVVGRDYLARVPPATPSPPCPVVDLLRVDLRARPPGRTLPPCPPERTSAVDVRRPGYFVGRTEQKEDRDGP